MLKFWKNLWTFPLSNKCILLGLSGIQILDSFLQDPDPHFRNVDPDPHFRKCEGSGPRTTLLPNADTLKKKCSRKWCLLCLIETAPLFKNSNVAHFLELHSKTSRAILFQNLNLNPNLSL